MKTMSSLGVIAVAALGGLAVGAEPPRPDSSPPAMQYQPAYETNRVAPPAKRSRLSPQPEDLAIQAVHNFAACVADETPRGAAELLALDYRTSEYQKKARALSRGHDDRCIYRAQLRYNPLLFAGGLAERLVTAGAPEQSFTTAVRYDPARPPIEARGASEAIGMCVARTAPAASWALLTSQPTSATEVADMRSIVPTLIGCVPNGQKMALNRPALRAIVALGAYRLAHPDAVSAVGRS